MAIRRDFQHGALVMLSFLLQVALADVASGIDRELLEQQSQGEEVLGVDEGECAAVQGDESDGDCALSLRQLRKQGGTSVSGAAALEPVHDAETEDLMDEAVDEEDADDPGIPGGWGEAAGFAEAVTHDEELLPNVTDSDVHANYLWGSCRQYRCVSYYYRSHGCQCNPGCSFHGSCCRDYWSRCQYNRRTPARSPIRGGRVLTLYHQTSAYAGRLILQNGFRPGSSGWCGGGIYFALTPEDTYTKAIGPQSHQGFMIEAKVNVGRVKYLSSKCDRSLNGRRVSMQRFDSVSFDPGDGREYVVYSKDRILSTRPHAL